MMKIRVTLFGLIFIAVFCLIKSQRQIIPSNQFFLLQRPNLQLIQLHAQQQQRPSFPPPPSPLNQRRQFRTQQQQITRRPIPRISLRRRNISAERSLRAGISRNKPARIILDPNLSNEITKKSDNRFIPQLQLRTQGNANFSRSATTVAPQRFAPPRQAPPQRPPPPPIEVTPSRGPAVRPPVLRRPPLPSSAPTRTQSMPQRSPQPQQPPPPPRSPTQSREQPPSRTPVPQQQQHPRPPPQPSTQQQTFLRPPTSPRMSPSMQRPPMPRPQIRQQPSLSPPPPQQKQQFNQPRPPATTMPSPPPPPLQLQQQQRPRITPEQRFTRPDQARMSPSAPIGPPRPSPSMTTNNIDDPSPPLQSRVRSSALSPPPSAHMPGFLPPSNSVVDELNNSKNFLEVARRLHLRRVIRGSAH
jgi:hypothetical protein|uniref:Uncharacterized protein n=1 Tax=Panagrolaimus sp. PS1159 TaxID=55785 RepID=A0AC35FLQ7_9BILA